MITQEEVRSVASLARVSLSEEEVVRFQKELSAVLDFFSQLETLNTDTVEPIGHITGRLGEGRADEAIPAEDATKKGIHNNFPESEEGHLTVSSVL